MAGESGGRQTAAVRVTGAKREASERTIYRTHSGTLPTPSPRPNGERGFYLEIIKPFSFGRNFRTQVCRLSPALSSLGGGEGESGARVTMLPNLPGKQKTH
jgi:hypothetical protein